MKLIQLLSRPLLLLSSLSILPLLFQNCTSFKAVEVEAVSSSGQDFCLSNAGAPECLTQLSEVSNITSTQKDCQFDGKSYEDGQVVTAFLNSTELHGGTCRLETRLCKDGILSGSFQYSSCKVNAPASCLFNGKTIENGSSVKAFRNSAVAFGSSCEQENRSCLNGTLSGAFSFGHCETDRPMSCLFGGLSIKHGDSIQAFTSSQVPATGQCNSVTRTCYNGALSGTGDFVSCSKEAPKSCLFDGKTIVDGQSVNAFQHSNVSAGDSCAEERRRCSNGVLSGTFLYASCMVNQPRSCLHNGQTIVDGQSIVQFFSGRSNSEGLCPSEKRTCKDGLLSGTASSSSCVSPTIEDIFEGQADFESIGDSSEISYTFLTPNIHVFDQKMTLFSKPGDSSTYAFTRGTTDGARFNVYLMKSTDGVSYSQVGDPVFDTTDGWTFYDPHVTVDNRSGQAIYIMAMECAKVSGAAAFGASACLSTSTTPWISTSWTKPKLIVQSDALRSASTPVVFLNGDKLFLAWSVLDDGLKEFLSPQGHLMPDDGDESLSTWVVELKNTETYLGLSTKAGKLLLGAELDVNCKTAWDCNNVNLMDFKTLKEKYYAIYGGGNYYRCDRPSGSEGTNEMAIAIRRSSDIYGKYSESTGPLIKAVNPNVCGIGYSTLNYSGFSYFMNYTYYTLGVAGVRQSKMVRSRLIWKNRAASLEAELPKTPLFNARISSGQLSLGIGELVLLSKAYLTLQSDGKLAVIEGSASRPGKTLWTSSNISRDCSQRSCSAVFQSDGNLVLYEEGIAYWQSMTNNQGKTLVFSDTFPFLEIEDSSNRVIWKADFSNSKSYSGFKLQYGESLFINSLRLVFQSDGNFVAYLSNNSGHESVVWASSTDPYCRGKACEIVFQTDGNLVIYNQGVPVWDTQTARIGKSFVLSNSPPYLSILDSNQNIVWKSE